MRDVLHKVNDVSKENQPHIPPRGRPPWATLTGAILPGATLSERLIACFAALIGIAVAGTGCHLLTGNLDLLPLIVPPIGASAVLVFVVPASPLAQPWPVIGGNTLSAAIGLAIAHLVAQPALAAGLAVALAILVMSLTRSLHPPGGAAALMAALGGGTVATWGPAFPLVPVFVNSCLLVAVALAFHRFTRHSYPHVAAPMPAGLPRQVIAWTDEDIDSALTELDETFDITRDDLVRIVRQIDIAAQSRRGG